MIFRLILDQLWGNLKVKKIFILFHRNHYKHMHRFFRRLTGAVWVYSGSQLYKVASRKASPGILSLLYVERGSFRKQKCRYWWDGFSMRVESNWKVADKNVYGREYAASETLLSVCLTSGCLTSVWPLTSACHTLLACTSQQKLESVAVAKETAVLGYDCYLCSPSALSRAFYNWWDESDFPLPLLMFFPFSWVLVCLSTHPSVVPTSSLPLLQWYTRGSYFLLDP